ncbi:NAD(P)H-binding protein [Streptomyces mirabilis]
MGATGGVGSRLAARLIEQGDQVVRSQRHTEQARTLESDGVEPVHGTVTSLGVDTPAARLEGAAAIVCSTGASGAGPRQADAVEGQGGVIAATAAAKAGVHRVLLVSAFPCPARPTGYVSICGGRNNGGDL